MNLTGEKMECVFNFSHFSPLSRSEAEVQWKCASWHDGEGVLDSLFPVALFPQRPHQHGNAGYLLGMCQAGWERLKNTGPRFQTANCKSKAPLLTSSSFLAGLKSMVGQGVKNPLVDLLALDDKTLDEVFLTRKPEPMIFPVSPPPSVSLTSSLCRRVMEFARRCPRPRPLARRSRRAVTPLSSSASTITAPWCWQRAHVKGNNQSQAAPFKTDLHFCLLCFSLVFLTVL